MDPTSFDSGLFFWSLATFAVLFLLLAKFTFKPLRKVLDQRESVIRDSLAAAEKSQAESEKTLLLNEEKREEARVESRKIMSEGHKIVSDMKREAQAQTKEEADKAVRQAKEEIDREVQRSLEALKSTVAGLSLRIARQVIKEEMNDARHEELADKFIERLKKTHAQTQPHSREAR
jgi:F-type H+-transporting ATPase subunit b